MNRYGWNKCHKKKAGTLFSGEKGITGPAVRSDVRDDRAEAQKRNQKAEKEISALLFLR